MHGSYGPDFRAELRDLMGWRRDVRRFRAAPVEAATLSRCLDAFSLSPSVGLSEPWRLVLVDSAAARAAVLTNFRAANAQALAGYSGEKAALYSGLKLAGLSEAPEHLAVFCDNDTSKGAGLGAQTMAETRAYSVVAAITQFWLAARAEGLGVGWVSILDPAQLCRDLAVQDAWRLVAYLCVGWPEADSRQPELERLGWETRASRLQVERR